MYYLLLLLLETWQSSSKSILNAAFLNISKLYRILYFMKIQNFLLKLFEKIEDIFAQPL